MYLNLEIWSSRSRSASRASLTVIFTVKSSDPLRHGKIWEIRFFTLKTWISCPKPANRWWHMLRSGLVFSYFNFMYYWGQGGPFSPGDHSISSQRWQGPGVQGCEYEQTITAQHIFQGWILLRCVLCCDLPIKNLNQSAGGLSIDQKTFARSLSNHLGKRGPPDLYNAWNWNLKRPNPTSASAIIDSGRFWTRYSRFQGEELNLPYFSCPGGSPPQSLFLRYEVETRLRAVYRSAHFTALCWIWNTCCNSRQDLQTKLNQVFFESANSLKKFALELNEFSTKPRQGRKVLKAALEV